MDAAASAAATGGSGSGSGPNPALEPRDHDVQYADRKKFADADAGLARKIVTRVHKFAQKVKRLKNPTMRQHLMSLHTLSEHYEVSAELLDELVEECLQDKTIKLRDAYEKAVSSLSKKKYEAEKAKYEASLERCNTEAQKDVFRRNLLRLGTEPPICDERVCDPALKRMIDEVVDSEEVKQEQKTRLLVNGNRAQRKYEAMMKRLGLAVQTRDQLDAMALVQYAEVKDEFKDYKSKAVTTTMLWNWFKGRVSHYVDGRAFWDKYAVACGYVDANGAPLLPNVDEAGNDLPKGKQIFHCDHIKCRKAHRTSAEQGKSTPCYQLDHWSNYAIKYAKVNMDPEMKDGDADEISEIKRYMHGDYRCDLIERGIIARTQQHDKSQKHLENVVKSVPVLKDQASKHLTGWEPNNRDAVHVGAVTLMDTRRRPTGAKAKVADKAPPPNQPGIHEKWRVCASGQACAGNDVPATSDATTPPGLPPPPAGDSAKAAGKRPAPPPKPAAKKTKLSAPALESEEESESDEEQVPVPVPASSSHNTSGASSSSPITSCASSSSHTTTEKIVKTKKKVTTALANHNMAATIPEPGGNAPAGAGPTQKPAGQKRKRDSAELLEVSVFLENLGGEPGLPDGWESEMVDRAKDGKSRKSSDKRLSGPDKEGNPVWVRTVKHAWLVHGGFARGESACQTLDKQLKEYRQLREEQVPVPASSSHDTGAEAAVSSQPAAVLAESDDEQEAEELVAAPAADSEKESEEESEEDTKAKKTTLFEADSSEADSSEVDSSEVDSSDSCSDSSSDSSSEESEAEYPCSVCSKELSESERKWHKKTCGKCQYRKRRLR